MGGGDKKKQQELERRAREAETRANAALATAGQKSPSEQAIERENEKWLKWSSGDAGPIDVRNAPGMGPALSLYDYATADRADDTAGRGLLTMGENATSPGFIGRLRELMQARRQEREAGRLENAVRMKDAQVRGGVGDLLGLQNNRSLALAGITSGSNENAWSNYTRFQPQSSGFLSTLLRGAAGAGLGFLTGGPMGAVTGALGTVARPRG